MWEGADEVIAALCWWLSGAGFGVFVASAMTGRKLRAMRAERVLIFAEQRARIDALQERNERRYAELRKKLGLQPEMPQ